MSSLAWLVAGGVLGTLGRFGLQSGSERIFGNRFPLGTFFVNLLGCFVMGLAAALVLGRFAAMRSDFKLFAMTGFCGAFTTFSALVFEMDAMMRQGDLLRAVIYAAGSVIAGLALFWAGFALGRG